MDPHPADPTRSPAPPASPARGTERRWQALTEAVDSVVWIAGADGGFAEPQPEFEAFTGLEWPADSGLGWLDAVHADTRRRFETAWKRALREKLPFEAEGRIRHAASGRWRWFAARAVPVLDDAGGVVEWVGTITDTDERRRAVEATRRSQAELADAHRRREGFLATLSLELRGRLAPIRNAVEILRLRGSEDPALLWGREVMERQVSQMARLVDDLIDVARMTRGDIELHRGVCDLASLVARAAEVASPLVDARRHSLIITLPPEPILLEADAARLGQALVNLIDNAARFTDPGGRIWITGRRAPGGEGGVELRVRDNGIGIDAASLPHVFDVFAQADRSLRRGNAGIGVGLTFARRVVELHGGTLTAESEGPGRGAQFVVRMPALRQGRPDPSSGAVPGGRSGQESAP